MQSLASPLTRSLQFPLGQYDPLLEDPSLELLIIPQGYEGGMTATNLQNLLVYSANWQPHASVQTRINDDVNTTIAIYDNATVADTDYLEFDFGSGNEKEVVKAIIYGRSDDNWVSHGQFQFQYYDGATWQNIDSQFDLDNVSGTLEDEASDTYRYEITFESVGARQRWRYLVKGRTGTAGYWYLSEVKFYKRSGRSDKVINLTPKQGVYKQITGLDETDWINGSGSGWDTSNHEAVEQYLFDGNRSTSDAGYYSLDTIGWGYIDLGATKNIGKFRMSTNGGAGAIANMELEVYVSDTIPTSATDGTNVIDMDENDYFSNLSFASYNGDSTWDFTWSFTPVMGRYVIVSNPLAGTSKDIRELYFYEKINRNGTLNGALWKGNALSFDGDDVVDIPESSDPAYTELTIFGYLLRDGGGTFVGRGEYIGSDPSMTFETLGVSGRPLIYLADANWANYVAVTSTNGFTSKGDGKYHSMALVYNGSGSAIDDRYKFYGDGEPLAPVEFNEQSGTEPTTIRIPTDLSGWQIGNSADRTNPLIGSVAMVAIFTRRLSSDEIQRLHKFVRGLV